MFPGDHPLAADCRGRRCVEEWFERVGREFPRLELREHEVAAKGFPWDVRVFVRLTDTYHFPDGSTMENTGFHYLRVRWGKVVEDQIAVDTQKVAEAAERFAAMKRAQAPGG